MTYIISMNKFIASNVNQLRRLKAKDIEGATKANVKRIDEIIKLYGERKISNIATAENLNKGLTSSNKKVMIQHFRNTRIALKNSGETTIKAKDG